MRFLAIILIRFYQKHLVQRHNRECIYTPSCSHYAIAALNKYGFVKGCWATVQRIRRCNGALYKGGVDNP